ncbi:MAG: DnaB-like helicase C-terminal domain-containing protein [Acidobacteriota bacterium]
MNGNSNTAKDHMALELSALNSMLSSKECFFSVAAVNPPAGIFSCQENRFIFNEAMSYFFNTGHVPDSASVYENLILNQSTPELRKHLRENILNAEWVRNTGDAIKLLTEIKIEREVRDFIKTTRDTGLDFAMGLVEYINSNLQENIGGCMKEIKNINTGEDALREVDNAMKGKPNQYIRTLIPELDKNVMGIPKNHITVIAARPGMGKTDFMLQLMRNFIKQGLKPAIFSLEMEAESLFVRNISEAACIDSLRIEKGEINDAEFKMLVEAAKPYAVDDYVIDDNALETPETIKAKINYWRLRHKVDVIMIDYMTLIKTHYQQERYDLEVGALVRDLRVFAKKTGIPIIILSQLNRDSEKRLNHRPQISDLRESGSIEQEAKLVLMLYRPIDYGIDPFEGKQFTYYDMLGNLLKADEYLEILIAKARSGRTGMVPVRYLRPVHRIESVNAIKN